MEDLAQAVLRFAEAGVELGALAGVLDIDLKLLGKSGVGFGGGGLYVVGSSGIMTIRDCVDHECIEVVAAALVKLRVVPREHLTDRVDIFKGNRVKHGLRLVVDPSDGNQVLGED